VAGGKPSASGNFGIQIHGELELYDLAVDWQEARITIEEEVIADSISLGFRGALLPFDPKVVKGPAVIDQISGDLKGDADLQIVGPRVSVRDLDLGGDRLEAMAELELEGEEHAGIFWGKLGIVSFGMERIRDRTDFKLINDRKWYEERHAAQWSGGERP
jgi:hypothetical protein